MNTESYGGTLCELGTDCADCGIRQVCPFKLTLIERNIRFCRELSCSKELLSYSPKRSTLAIYPSLEDPSLLLELGCASVVFGEL